MRGRPLVLHSRGHRFLLHQRGHPLLLHWSGHLFLLHSRGNHHQDPRPPTRLQGKAPRPRLKRGQTRHKQKPKPESPPIPLFCQKRKHRHPSHDRCHNRQRPEERHLRCRHRRERTPSAGPTNSVQRITPALPAPEEYRHPRETTATPSAIRKETTTTGKHY